MATVTDTAPAADLALPTAAIADLEEVLSRRPAGAGQLTITFATADFEPLLNNWLAHAARAGERSPLVVALDDRLANALKRTGVAVIRYRTVLSAADLWIQRVLFFEYLARRGVDFVHSDVDAVWMRDPRPLCFADAGLDLVFSQGTNHPAEIWRRWGFVLCCGLFAVKGTPASANFFRDVRGATARVGDDQVVVNHLLDENGLVWDKTGMAGYALPVNDTAFRAWRHTLKGTCAKLDLQVGMLPHHRVPRLPDRTPIAWVRHPLGPGNPDQKAALLRQLDCWIVD